MLSAGAGKREVAQTGDGEDSLSAQDCHTYLRTQQPVCSPVVLLELSISVAMLFCSVLLGATLLILAPMESPEARALHPSPDSPQLMEQLLDRYNDLLTMDDLENLLSSPAEEQSTLSSGAKASEFPAKWADVQPETPWLRLLRDALANRKPVESERSRRGWNRGCFGLKLDRIGSMSGLGC
ncbi:C-type natriuretic peptide 1 isoform X2 [Syngnathus acus]|uniref:C-type natriuretic peptide 1 isoform X2 n=1 Tax=Syngnathus acus TaxID=161584 RepID=UPI001885C2A5|nr:C-type natriuretic peptide 1 isoform X2 [Syngnathus acus]